MIWYGMILHFDSKLLGNDSSWKKITMATTSARSSNRNFGGNFPSGNSTPCHGKLAHYHELPLQSSSKGRFSIAMLTYHVILETDLSP